MQKMWLLRKVQIAPWLSGIAGGESQCMVLMVPCKQPHTLSARAMPLPDGETNMEACCSRHLMFMAPCNVEHCDLCSEMSYKCTESWSCSKMLQLLIPCLEKPLVRRTRTASMANHTSLWLSP